MQKLPSRFAFAACALLAFTAFGNANAAGSIHAVHGAAVKGVSATPTLAATDLVVNLTGVKSFDALDSPLNTYFAYSVGAGKLVDGLAWSLTLATTGSSWL